MFPAESQAALDLVTVTVDDGEGQEAIVPLQADTSQLDAGMGCSGDSSSRAAINTRYMPPIMDDIPRTGQGFVDFDQLRVQDATSEEEDEGGADVGGVGIFEGDDVRDGFGGVASDEEIAFVGFVCTCSDCIGPDLVELDGKGSYGTLPTPTASTAAAARTKAKVSIPNPARGGQRQDTRKKRAVLKKAAERSVIGQKGKPEAAKKKTRDEGDEG